MKVVRKVAPPAYSAFQTRIINLLERAAKGGDMPFKKPDKQSVEDGSQNRVVEACLMNPLISPWDTRLLLYPTGRVIVDDPTIFFGGMVSRKVHEAIYQERELALDFFRGRVPRQPGMGVPYKTQVALLLDLNLPGSGRAPASWNDVIVLSFGGVSSLIIDAAFSGERSRKSDGDGVDFGVDSFAALRSWTEGLFVLTSLRRSIKLV